MFLREKRNGSVKGRGCADGRKHRKGTKKEDGIAPTVAIELLMLSCTIDTLEGRDVATVDIPGAFMQADMDETVHVKLEGTMAELFTRLDPKMLLAGSMEIRFPLDEAVIATVPWARTVKSFIILHELHF
jgi:hypothetical protein